MLLRVDWRGALERFGRDNKQPNERKMIDILGLPILDAAEIVEFAVLIVFGVRLIQARCAKLGWPEMASVVESRWWEAKILGERCLAASGLVGAVPFGGMAGAPMSNII